MKRKNILRFVSVLGIGSFVMLAAASCSQASTINPNQTSNTTPADPTKELMDARDALTSLVDTRNDNVKMYADYLQIQDILNKAYNTGQAVLNNTASSIQDLKDAEASLRTAISTADSSRKAFDEKNASLVSNYQELKTTVNTETSTLERLKDPQFSRIRDVLVPLFDAGKTLTNQPLEAMDGSVPLDPTKVSEANQKLKDATGTNLLEQIQNVMMFSDGFVKEVIDKAKLTGSDITGTQPGNYSFVGYSIDLNFAPKPAASAPAGSSAGGSGVQPAVAGSESPADSTNSTTDLPTWNYAYRSVWINENGKNKPLSEEDSKKLTNVSWIYSLAGKDAKYTLTFNYYGSSSTAYLYFPYKLVKDGDNVALQYKLNGGVETAINFGTQATEVTETPASEPKTKGAMEDKEAPKESVVMAKEVEGEPKDTKPSESENTDVSPETTADKEMSAATPAVMNEAPTVDDIKLAKIPLTNLNFGQNTLEFSVPKNDQDPATVAPMIGNMYLTSSEQNLDKIYDDLFGSKSSQQDNKTTVSVDLLKGYGLGASYLEYVRQFTDLNNEKADGQESTKAATTYLVGFIGGGVGRNDAESVPTSPTSPHRQGEHRTLTVYVNAPQEGDYYISGSYLNGDTTTDTTGTKSRRIRYLKLFTNNTTDTSNSVVFQVKSLGDWNTLGIFDTQTEKNIVKETTTSTVTTQSNPSAMSVQAIGAPNASKTLKLQKGLNKIIITGMGTNLTPYVGNLTFTLKTSMDANSSMDAGSSDAK
ncbi:FIVAR domain-containing protein [Mycoplasma tullyi]|uniref:FIVAR domain-containing protein n=1 Tax=Mycoplasma tullyi TaxID=1612150 RepID=A0A7D7Y4C6_9MOLU|nr:FIVAR domain-containing protein [Mycoplasma tullyi]QMT98277.1 FIVAR domain-containing protein [Mycoplasma tullyi]